MFFRYQIFIQDANKKVRDLADKFFRSYSIVPSEAHAECVNFPKKVIVILSRKMDEGAIYAFAVAVNKTGQYVMVASEADIKTYIGMKAA